MKYLLCWITDGVQQGCGGQKKRNIIVLLLGLTGRKLANSYSRTVSLIIGRVQYTFGIPKQYKNVKW